jgi:hypothetical protein
MSAFSVLGQAGTNQVLEAIAARFDDIEANITNLECVENITYKDGVFSWTLVDGTTTSINFLTEGLGQDFDLNYDPVEKALKITKADGDVLSVDISDLIDIYTAKPDADKIQIVINNNEVSATVVAGSINSADLDDDVQDTLSKAKTAYQKPVGGITGDDIAYNTINVNNLSVEVNNLLSAISSALQPANLQNDATGGTPGVNALDAAMGDKFALKTGTTFTGTVNVPAPGAGVANENNAATRKYVDDTLADVTGGGVITAVTEGTGISIGGTASAPVVNLENMPANTVKGAVVAGAPVNITPVQLMQLLASNSTTANNTSYVFKRGSNAASWSMEETPEPTMLTKTEINTLLVANGFQSVP